MSFDQYSFSTKWPFFAKKELSFTKLSPAGSRSHFLSISSGAVLQSNHTRRHKNMSLRAVLLSKVYSGSYNFSGGDVLSIQGELSRIFCDSFVKTY